MIQLVIINKLQNKTYYVFLKNEIYFSNWSNRYIIYCLLVNTKYIKIVLKKLNVKLNGVYDQNEFKYCYRFLNEKLVPKKSRCKF